MLQDDLIRLLHELLHLLPAEDSPHHREHLPQLRHVNVPVSVAIKNTESIPENDFSLVGLTESDLSVILKLLSQLKIQNCCNNMPDIIVYINFICFVLHQIDKLKEVNGSASVNVNLHDDSIELLFTRILSHGSENMQ